MEKRLTKNERSFTIVVSVAHAIRPYGKGRNDEKNSSGIITETVINNETLLEFRTLKGEAMLNGHYKSELEMTDTEDSTKETLLLYPVNISIKGFTLTGEAPVRFERTIQK